MTTPTHDLSRLRIDRDPPPKVRRAFGRTAAIASGLVVLIAAGVIWVRSRSAVEVGTVIATPLAGGSAGGGPAATMVTANGYVVARIRASVSAKIPGRIASLTVDGGSEVRRGQVIARLENADYAAAVAEAKANLASARAELAAAVAGRDQSAARTVAAQAKVEAARASLGYAEATLENTYIRAPFTGTVLRKEAEIGEVVAPSVGGGLTRGAVVTMADLGSLEVEVDVNEAYIARVHHAQPARITLDAYPDTAFRGAVRQVVPTADRQRATVQVKVSILDRDPRILPEMGARVDFLAGEPDSTAGGDTAATAAASTAPRFRLPASAVREAGGRTIVWLVREGRLQSREVQAGPVSGDYREISRGLAGGEQVVTGEVEGAKEGMKVKTAISR